MCQILTMIGSTYCMSPVASSTMIVREMVMREIPPVMAVAPMSAYVPLEEEVKAKKTDAVREKEGGGLERKSLSAHV